MSLNKILDRDVKAIKNDLQQMIEETKIQYAEAYQAIKTNDQTLANMVVEHDKIINGMQNEFTSMALWKIAKQQMVAGDLRLAVGSILIAREVEIIADYSKNICKTIFAKKQSNKKMEYITAMFEIVVKMLDTISNIFDDTNQDLLENALTLENNLNKEFALLDKKLIQKMRESDSQETAFEINQTIKSIKQLERAGDHLINIFEIVIFIKTGKFDDLEKQTKSGIDEFLPDFNTDIKF